jgi:hypothetical protein
MSSVNSWASYVHRITSRRTLSDGNSAGLTEAIRQCIVENIKPVRPDFGSDLELEVKRTLNPGTGKGR